MVSERKSAQGQNLSPRIDNLVTRAILTREGAAILHKLRVLGNEAAHEVSPHAMDRLKVGIEVAEHMLEGAHRGCLTQPHEATMQDWEPGVI